MMGHGKILCSCGVVVDQCACLTCPKPVFIYNHECPACKAKLTDERESQP